MARVFHGSTLKWVLLALLLGMLAAAVRFYVYLPYRDAVAAAEAEIDRLEMEIRRLHDLDEGLLEAQLDALRAEYESLQDQLQQGARKSSFLAYLEHSANATETVVTRLEFAPAEPVEGIDVLRFPATIVLEGNYPNVLDFIGRMTDVFPFVTLDDLEVRALTSAVGGNGGTAGAETAAALSQRGTVELVLFLTVLGKAGGNTDWDRELLALVDGMGRDNPFTSVPQAADGEENGAQGAGAAGDADCDGAC